MLELSAMGASGEFEALSPDNSAAVGVADTEMIEADAAGEFDVLTPGNRVTVGVEDTDRTLSGLVLVESVVVGAGDGDSGPEIEEDPLTETELDDETEKIADTLSKTDPELDTLRVPDTEPVSLTELNVECVPLTDTDDVTLSEPVAVWILVFDVTPVDVIVGVPVCVEDVVGVRERVGEGDGVAVNDAASNAPELVTVCLLQSDAKRMSHRRRFCDEELRWRASTPAPETART